MPVVSSRKPYRVGRSRTGLGLFATRPIEKGTEIVRYFGPLLDCRKPKDDAIENKYLFQINSRWTIDGSVRRNVARYINHACRPNAESDVNQRQRRVVIRAIKNIAPGEEINYDYGTEYFKAYLKPIGCKCDACERKRARARAEARAAKTGTAKTPAAGKTKTKTKTAKTSKTKQAKARTSKTKTARSVAASKAKAGKAVQNKTARKPAGNKAVKKTPRRPAGL